MTLCGHINYARWGPGLGIIDVSEKRILMEKKPDIFQALERSQSVIHHTTRGIWQDMAIEQSINRDCGKSMRGWPLFYDSFSLTFP